MTVSGHGVGQFLFSPVRRGVVMDDGSLPFVGTVDLKPVHRALLEPFHEVILAAEQSAAGLSPSPLSAVAENDDY